MRKLLCLTLIFGLLTTFTLNGYGQNTGNSENEGSPKETAKSKPAIVLKFNDWNPPGAKVSDLWEDVAIRVGGKSNGRIQIKNYLSGSLVKFQNTFKGVSSGVADISQYLMGSAPGIHVLNEIFDMPFLGFKNYDQAYRIYNEILNEYPEIQSENEKKGVRMISIRPMLPYHIHSVKKPIILPSDLKGEKVIATGYLGSVAGLSGGIAMQAGPADWYGSLQKGVVQHDITHFVVLEDFKLSELLSYHTVFGDGGLANSGIAVLANLKVWENLTPEDQKILTEAYNWYQEEISKYDVEQENKYIEKMKMEGQKFNKLTPAQIQQWKTAVGMPIIEKWIQDTEAKGLPAKKIFDAIQNKISHNI